MCVHRKVDVFLRYTRVLQATNERDQTRFFEAKVKQQIVHEYWLLVQFVDFRHFRTGLECIFEILCFPRISLRNLYVLDP